MSEEEDPFVLSILIKSGTYNDMMTLALLASGAVASDFEVRIFAMDDAVWALRKEVIGSDNVLHSHFPEYSEKLAESLNSGKVMPWWRLLADLKEMGELTITACALVADVVGLDKEDFSDLVDDIAGVATFAADIEDSDQVIVL